ncbi:MAG: hypothetical protein Ta2G_19680 [Termitinemataceae bacterium]|nr:MAG: hypothetical protein Ta2G_19680 [Termitinemataceae bacterium]
MQPAADHSSLLQDFNASLADDLNTPRSLSSLWTLLKNDSLKPEDILAAAFKMDEVLGLSLAESLQQKAAPEVDSALAAQIEEQIALRAAAKKAKDFAKADTIRNQLKENGIILEDSQSGTIWHKA